MAAMACLKNTKHAQSPASKDRTVSRLLRQMVLQVVVSGVRVSPVNDSKANKGSRTMMEAREGHYSDK